MDLPFSSGIGASIFSQKTVAGSRGTATINSSSGESNNADAVKQFLDEAKSLSTNTERAGKFLTLSNVKSAIDIATSAVSEIADLNAQQVALAAEASELATGAKTADLNSEASTIENRIRSIYDSAKFNGKSLLDGTTNFATQVSSADLSDAINLPSLSSIVTTISSTVSRSTVVFSTQSSALSAYDTLVTRGDSISGLQGSYESAQGKATSILETTLVDAAKAPDAVTDINTAEKLASDIANKISSQFASEESTKQLIDATIGSDPDTKKIADLLAAP